MIPAVDPDKMLPKVEKIIYLQAWKFVAEYPISFEDAKAEAYWAFVRACYSFDPNRGATFPTWCFFKVWCRLKDLIMKRSGDPHVCMTDLRPWQKWELAQLRLEEDLEEAPQETERFMQKVEDWTFELPTESKQLLDSVLSPPPELLDGKRPTAKQLMGRAKRLLMSNGAEKDQVKAAHLELEMCLKEAWKV